MQGGLKMLSIRLDSIKSTRIVSPGIDSLYRKSIYARLRKYSIPAVHGKLKILSIRLDSIESSQIVSPGVDSLYRKSICARLKKFSFAGPCRVG